MTDIHYNFVLLLLTAYLVRNLRKNNLSAVSSIVCGVLAGLAFSIKIIGIIVGFWLFIAAILYRRITRPVKQKLVEPIMIALVSSLITIYGLNPHFWPSAKILDARLITHETRSILVEFKRSSFETEQFSNRYPQLSNLARVLEFPRLFLRWNDQMKGQKTKFSGEFKGNRLLLIQKRLFWDYSSFPLEFVFFAVGITVCGIRLRRSFMTRKTEPAVIPFCYFFINYIFMLLFLDIDWDRYFLPVVIASKIIVAIGISSVIDFVSSRISNSYQDPRAVQERIEGS